MRKWNILGVLTMIIEIFVIIGILQLNCFEEHTKIIISTIIFILLFAIAMFFFWKDTKRLNIEKEEIKEDRTEMLKERYSYYISLVNNKMKKFKNENEFSQELILTDYEYLNSFKKHLDWICENKITGKPDTFIVASCLMYSLIEKPRIRIPGDNIIDMKLKEDLGTTLKEVYSKINCEIALQVALELISEPTTYYEDENGEWIEKKHPKVNIVIPEGLIDKSPLYNRIINSIYIDKLQNDSCYNIMQFSHLLHLIYLSSK